MKNRSVQDTQDIQDTQDTNCAKHELRVKFAVAKVCNVEPGDLTPQDAVS